MWYLHHIDDIVAKIRMPKGDVLLMKGGQNPNRSQKQILSKDGKNANEWLLVKTTVDTYLFKHKVSNEVIELPKSSR